MQLPPTACPDRKPVVLITTHRAGSVISNKILATLHAMIGVPHIDFANAAQASGSTPEADLKRHLSLLKTPGYYFGALRGPAIGSLGLFQDQRAVIHIRDPRDCIVSGFFSRALSHPPPPPGENRRRFLEKRRAAREQEIDAFCLQLAPTVGRVFAVLSEIRDGHPDYWLSRYEDMVLETEPWLAGLAGFLDIPLTDEARAGLAPLLRFSVSQERPHHQIRQIMPGDHRRKLKAETISEITEILAPQLQAFGYSSGK